MICSLITLIAAGTFAPAAHATLVSSLWSPGADVPVPRIFAAYASSGESLWVAGGTTGGPGGVISAAVYSYSPTSNSWTTQLSLPSPRMSGAMATDAFGRLYYIGGFGDAGQSSTVLRLDPLIGWTQVASMPGPRQLHSAVTGPDGAIYVFGGEYLGTQATTFRYDPALDSWSTRAAMPTPSTSNMAALGNDGAIYVMGGRLPTLPFATSSKAIRRYDPVANTWTTSATTLPVPLMNGMAVRGPEGIVYLFGGLDTATGQLYTLTAAWDAKHQVLSGLADMPNPHRGGAAATVGNRIVVATGGGGFEGATKTDILDVAVVTASPTTLPFGFQVVNQPAVGSNSVLLQDTGRVSLVVASMSVVGEHADEFEIVGTTCPTEPNNTANCTIDIEFVPKALGERSATLVIDDDGNEYVREVPLTGRGAASALVVTPSGDVPAGQQVQYSAMALDNDGAPLRDVTNEISWLIEPSGTCAPGGKCTAPGPGAYTVKAIGFLAQGTAAITARQAIGLGYLGPSTVPAGVPFGVSFIAFDHLGVVGTYRGTVVLTSSDPTATLPAPHVYVAADGGEHLFLGVTLYEAGQQTLTATDAAANLTMQVAIQVIALPSTTTSTSASTSSSSSSTTSNPSSTATSSTQPAGTTSTSTTSTSNQPGATTTTTLPDTCLIVESGPTFESITCRLSDLGTTVQALGDVASTAPTVRNTLGTVSDLLNAARSSCEAGDTKRAKRTLSKVLKKLGRTRTLLASKRSRALPGRDALVAAAQGLKQDGGALRRALSCPASAGTD